MDASARSLPNTVRPSLGWDVFGSSPIATLIVAGTRVRNPGGAGPATRGPGENLIVDANGAATRVLDRPVGEIIGLDLADLIADGRDLPDPLEPSWVTRTVVLPDGRAARLVALAAPMPDSTDLFTLTLIDPTQFGAAVPNDSLTGLPLRSSLQPSLDNALGSSDHLAVAFVDLDGFKAVNDGHGHLMGDEILRSAAHAIRSVVRSVDTVIRYGGDEFVIVFPGVERVDEVERIADRINDAVRGATAASGAPISASIGVAVVAADAIDRFGTLQAADNAMYRAKAAGGNQAIVELQT